MRSHSWLLFVLLVAFAAGNGAVTLARSTIPLSIDGTVTDVELRFEKQRQVDDVYLVTVNGRRLHVDGAVGRQVSEGDLLHKHAWSPTLDTPRGPVRLSPSLDFRRMLLAMPVVVLAGAFALARSLLSAANGRGRRQSWGR